jgi:alpha-L-rhamnosidase
MTALRISRLRCEYLVDPLGLDEVSPRLSWTLESARRGARQTAYRVRVASSPAKLARRKGDLWDSGRVESDRTAHVVYAGLPLRSRDCCCWRVEVWDETGARARSAPALWSMGLLAADDWSARWIAADPEIIRRDPGAIAPTLTEPGTPALFRREFEVPGAVARATLFASARGLFELRLNGRRVGCDLFAPEWTDYDRRIHYRTYDVTSLVTGGFNTLGATLGDGWWSGYVGWQETRGRYGSLQNSLLVQLEIELADGRRRTIGTDSSWRCNTGPILGSDFMMGEVYDARRERTGWDRPAYVDAGWLFASEVAPPAVPLVAQRSEPVQVMETLAPVATNEIRPGACIYDLGQNITGWVRLRLPEAPPGTQITLRHGERLNPDGTLYTENLRRAKATDVYICRGGMNFIAPWLSPEAMARQTAAGYGRNLPSPVALRVPAGRSLGEGRSAGTDPAAPAAGHEGLGDEVWEPHFTFHGFQYVEVAAEPPLPPLARVAVTGCVIHSATPPVGRFECSHAGVNRLWLNGLWSQRDNFLSVPTDCPQRDERLGWMGDAQVFLRTASYNMDVAAFFTKWMTDVADAQTPDGVFPDTAPRLREGANFIGLDGLGGAAGWADAGIIVPWTIWRVYGDRRILERHWPAMVAWLDWIERRNPDGLRVNELGNNYGDWLCIPSDTTFRTHSPMKNLLATACWADDAVKMARMARALGCDDGAKRFEAMFATVRAAFQREFLREDGRLTVETQTAYLLALEFGLLPEAVRSRAAERLVENIRALGWHLSTGFIGISHLNPVLTLTGHADVAYRLLLQEDYPSWLYPVKHGATTIWERWNGWTEQDGFFNPHMNSFNHYSLGSIGEWLFRHVAGIELDPEVPGFQRFVLRPYVGGGLDFAKGTYGTLYGKIESAWHRDGDNLSWEIRVPANTTARISVPSEPGTLVTESDGPVERAPGLKLIGREGRWLICEAAAGEYSFRSHCRAEES